MEFSPQDREAGLQAVAMAFGALGRVLVCLDETFTVVHTSPLIDDIVGPGTASGLVGRPVTRLVGADLLGPGGSLRRALEAGERREGWRAYLQRDHGSPVLVSLSAAPIDHAPSDPCDPRVRYLLVLRPDDEAPPEEGRGPTVMCGLIARSPAMLRIFDLVQSLSHSEATVLITGESGTGKGLLAKAIHEHSRRRREPFVSVNCAALPADLLESELFGHVRGAFTGAIRDRDGRFTLADGGSLFLDEIGDLEAPLQVKLLRVLQEGAFERVGESNTRHSDCRILAATNKDLRRAVRSGEFREDLYYRLRVVPIELPPLRDRREDIEPITRFLLSRIGESRGRLLRLAPSALAALIQHPWQGNVRELENALEYAVAICRGQTIAIEDLPPEVAQRTAERPATEPGPEADSEPPLVLNREPPERVLLERTLNAHGWRREETAKALGMSRTTLWRKMREHGLLSRY